VIVLKPDAPEQPSGSVLPPFVEIDAPLHGRPLLALKPTADVQPAGIDVVPLQATPDVVL
jgi:hypothetical protein